MILRVNLDCFLYSSIKTISALSQDIVASKGGSHLWSIYDLA